jgi:hypothetical protein
VSFNLPDGVSLGEAVDAIDATAQLARDAGQLTVRYEGSALAFRASLSDTLWLVLAAVVTMYIVLGVLYESFIHPLTILSTLPSAAIGALLALLVTGHELGMIAVIGIILLIGIVKKNAIMMIDFALDAERTRAVAARGHPRGLPAAPAPHPDDHAGGAARRAAADARRRRGLGAAPSARPDHGRRPAGEPGADAVHDAGHLSRLRPAVPARRAAAAEGGPHELPGPGHRRPVATTLLTLASRWRARWLSAAAGRAAAAGRFSRPFRSGRAARRQSGTMAATVATPLERTLGRIAGVTEMTSMQFAGHHQHHPAVRSSSATSRAPPRRAGRHQRRARQLPSGLPSNPTYRKVNPADSPVMMSGDHVGLGADPAPLYDIASTVLAQKMSQVEGIGQVTVGGGALPAVRVRGESGRAQSARLGTGRRAARHRRANVNRPKGALEQGERHWQIEANDQARARRRLPPLIVLQAGRRGAPGRRRHVERLGAGRAQCRLPTASRGAADPEPAAGRQHHRNRRPRARAAAAAAPA